MRMTHPGRMYGPAWRAGPSWICAVVLVTGPGVPSASGTPEPLRLLRDYLGDWSWYGDWNRSWNWGLLLSLGGTESDPRPEAGPTSGANHNCSGKRTSGQGRADQNGTKALQNVVTALNRGSWAGNQGTTGCTAVAQSRLGSGSGYRGWRWRLVTAVKAQ